MQQKSTKVFIIPLISLSIFMVLIFGAAYAYYVANISVNTSNYQITLPKQTTLVCTKTDCGVTVTPAQMSTSNTDSNNAVASNSCYVNCTCSGTPGSICTYNVSLVEMGNTYNPSPTLGSNKEFTATVINPSQCVERNNSSTENQVNNMRGKTVSYCSLTVPDGGSISANVGVDFKWYNPNIDQASHASQNYIYQLTSEEINYTVTFDANGGSVSETSRAVKYGDKYENLPTPTWAGHTFRGWNGKNKFNKYDYFDMSEYTQHGNYYSKTIPLKANTQYKMSVVRYNGFTGGNMGYLLISTIASINGSTWSSIAHMSNPNFSTVNFQYTTTSTAILYIGYYALNQSQMNTIWANTDVQLEEGTEVTAFEPYLITEDTRVTQTKDHTLIAIWD